MPGRTGPPTGQSTRRGGLSTAPGRKRAVGQGLRSYAPPACACMWASGDVRGRPYHRTGGKRGGVPPRCPAESAETRLDTECSISRIPPRGCRATLVRTACHRMPGHGPVPSRGTGPAKGRPVTATPGGMTLAGAEAVWAIRRDRQGRWARTVVSPPTSGPSFTGGSARCDPVLR
jgi:hypothetical protein